MAFLHTLRQINEEQNINTGTYIKIQSQKYVLRLFNFSNPTDEKYYV